MICLPDIPVKPSEVAELARDALGAALVAGANVSITPNDGADTITIAVTGLTSDHGGLSGLGDDDHTQYPLSAGRSGGQTVTGGTGSGDDLTLRSTSHGTKGDIFVADQGGDVIIGGGATASKLKMLEPSGSGANFTAFVTQAQSADITYTLPAAAGNNLGVLQTDGSAGLSWQDSNGTGNIVRAGSPTITTPTIASFTNATHTHQNAAGGGQLDHGLALTGLTDDDHSQYLLLAGRSGGQVVNGGSGSGDSIIIDSTSHSTKGIVSLAIGGSDIQIGGGTVVPVMKFRENSFNGINYVGLKAPNSIGATNPVFTLPALDGNNLGILMTNGSGGLSFVDSVGTGNVVRDTSPTIVTPTVASFVNATHNHQNAAGGGQLDHGLAITGLGDDDHTQYGLLAGRSGGQTLTGGTGASENLTLRSTSNGTKGVVALVDQGGNVTVGGAAAASELRFLEPSGGGTNYFGFKAQTMGSNLVMTLPAADGTALQALVTDAAGNLSFGRPSGSVIMAGSSTDGAVATGTTILPNDNTTPQNTEGTEFYTVSVTPTNANSTLRIRCTLNMAVTLAGPCQMALFVDSTANCLATAAQYASTANQIVSVTLEYIVTAGSTSSRTYRLRAGPGAASTMTINGVSSAGKYNSTMISGIVVEEILP